MKRLSSTEIKRILKLRKRGLSLSEIVNALNSKKTTVYYHIRKYFGRSQTPIKINLNDIESIGELIGSFAADGCFVHDKLRYSYQIFFFFSVHEKVYVKRFTDMLLKLLQKSPYVYVRSKENEIILRYKSKKLISLIKTFLFWKGKKTYSVRLKNGAYPKKFLLGFLRGVFDGDGYSDGDRRRISFITVSNYLAKQINEILIVFGFTPIFYKYDNVRPNRAPLYKIYLTKSQAVQFIKIINPRNPKRIRSWMGKPGFEPEFLVNKDFQRPGLGS